MHPDLSAHLHTPQCNELIDALNKCHKERTLAKFLGACTSLDTAVIKCLKQERIARSAANRAKARERQEFIKAKVNLQQ